MSMNKTICSRSKEVVSWPPVGTYTGRCVVGICQDGLLDRTTIAYDVPTLV
ncbi:hypothetical protein EDC56_1110 [Sinobacterium caligoides]|uniref:Uncharacterized protein n=1 Tax=Sinobacterium caligoides TaxID=933926 RepID=A0A3N2E0D6_9GAMM|nr:hypothetical protein EDC56_1110 [Sinobacterium caligoides]